MAYQSNFPGGNAGPSNRPSCGETHLEAAYRLGMGPVIEAAARRYYEEWGEYPLPPAYGFAGECPPLPDPAIMADYISANAGRTAAKTVGDLAGLRAENGHTQANSSWPALRSNITNADFAPFNLMNKQDDHLLCITTEATTTVEITFIPSAKNSRNRQGQYSRNTPERAAMLGACVGDNEDWGPQATVNFYDTINVISVRTVDTCEECETTTDRSTTDPANVLELFGMEHPSSSNATPPRNLDFLQTTARMASDSYLDTDTVENETNAGDSGGTASNNEPMTTSTQPSERDRQAPTAHGRNFFMPCSDLEDSKYGQWRPPNTQGGPITGDDTTTTWPIWFPSLGGNNDPYGGGVTRYHLSKNPKVAKMWSFTNTYTLTHCLNARAGGAGTPFTDLPTPGNWNSGALIRFYNPTSGGAGGPIFTMGQGTARTGSPCNENWQRILFRMASSIMLCMCRALKQVTNGKIGQYWPTNMPIGDYLQALAAFDANPDPTNPAFNALPDNIQHEIANGPLDSMGRPTNDYVHDTPFLNQPLDEAMNSVAACMSDMFRNLKKAATYGNLDAVDRRIPQWYRQRFFDYLRSRLGDTFDPNASDIDIQDALQDSFRNHLKSMFDADNQAYGYQTPEHLKDFDSLCPCFNRRRQTTIQEPTGGFFGAGIAFVCGQFGEILDSLPDWADHLQKLDLLAAAMGLTISELLEHVQELYETANCITDVEYQTFIDLYTEFAGLNPF